VGRKVRRGDVISYLGSTGKSTGPHVHYEVWYKGKAVNPAKYLTGRS
jgi:murein DD-endopeptidase MepM/ murein hydrolase activator NlpD